MEINWESISNFSDIVYERGLDDAKGIAKITNIGVMYKSQVGISE